jgi:MFS family permease
MGSAIGLWRAEGRARWFFAAHAQGGLGAAAGYVALLLLAYERIGTSWAAMAVLMADLLPMMLLGPLLGALVDRTSRLGCAIAADVARAAALGGLLLVDGIVPLIVLAAAAGVGNALFSPATSALLPRLVAEEHLHRASALYEAVRDAGQLLGPVLAAGLLLFGRPELVLGLNAATFAVSALLLCRLRGGWRGRVRSSEPAGEAPARPASLRAVFREPLMWSLMGTSLAVMLVGGTMNVGEIVLARQELGTSASGFALFAVAYGCGLISGSLLSAGDGSDEALRRRYLSGLVLMAGGLVGSALATALATALPAFAVTGLGNGLFVVSDRVLIQRLVPESLHGRAFGVLSSLKSWGLAGALVLGAALTGAAGARVTFALAGCGLLVVWLFAGRALRGARGRVPSLVPALIEGGSPWR